MAVLLGGPVRRASRSSPSRYGLRPDDGGRAVGRRRWRRRRRSGRGRRSFYAVRGAHRADPVPRREHELQRVPATRRDPGRGRLHAAPVRVPRRPPGVLVGHRRCWRRSRSGCSWRSAATRTPLIPLYSVGVFVCFTLSQVGMVRHWRRGPGPGWRWRLGDQRRRRGPHRRRPRDRRVREVPRRRVPRRDPHPDPGRR